jgi:TatD DNase family protein
VIPDAHCHLDQLEDPRRAVEEATAAGVGPILAVSMDAASAERTLELRERHRGAVLAGIGLHPGRIPALTPEGQRDELRRLEGLLSEADFIGEIGLDYKDAVADADRARQREALELQLGWAASRHLAVNLHSRRADREVLEAAVAFRGRTGLGALMHWFTHSTKLARLCADSGIFISPGPSVLVDPRTAEVARALAAPILLVETDSPVAYGSEGAARPAWAARVLSRLATLRDLPAEALARTVEFNFQRYLPGRERRARTDADLQADR